MPLRYMEALRIAKDTLRFFPSLEKDIPRSPWSPEFYQGLPSISLNLPRISLESPKVFLGSGEVSQDLSKSLQGISSIFLDLPRIFQVSSQSPWVSPFHCSAECLQFYWISTTLFIITWFPSPGLPIVSYLYPKGRLKCLKALPRSPWDTLEYFYALPRSL